MMVRRSHFLKRRKKRNERVLFYQAERRGQSEGGIPEDFIIGRLGIFKRRVTVPAGFEKSKA